MGAFYSRPSPFLFLFHFLLIVDSYTADMFFLILLRRELHVSWILAVASVGVTVGIISAQYVPIFSSTVWVFVGLGLLLYCLWRRRGYVVLIALIAGGLIGLWRGGDMQQAFQPYKKMIGHTAQVQGVVSDDVDVGKNGETLLRLTVTTVDGRSLQGSIWVAAGSHAHSDIKRSDEVTVKGKITAGFGSFAASMYRATIVKVERPQPGDIALSLRDYFAEKIRMNVPDPQASLGIGYLVGQRRALPEDLDKALQIAGLTHIVVASGYNLTILVRLARRVFVTQSKFMAAFAAGGMIVSFVAVSGMSPSMSRAGLVAGLSLLAWYYGRSFHPLVLLSLAAAATLLINPTLGWGDLGWQLSFAAFAGVMIVAPLMHRYFLVIKNQVRYGRFWVKRLRRS